MKNKNLWLLPIDKASRLVIYENNDFILLNRYEPNWIETNFNRTNQHIYITSDEEIKEGEWVLNISNNKIFKQDNSKYDGYTLSFYKKIILTTDLDLIKDGVQSIPDEFLEWFVNNPSCEKVETKLIEQRSHLTLNDWIDEDENGKFPVSIAGAFCYRKINKIIIQKEEPKQKCQHCKQTISKYGCACGKQKEEPINHPNILSNSLTNKVNKQEKSMKDTAEELAEIAIILTNNSANYQETLEEVAEKQCEVEGWGLYEGLSEQCAIKNSFKAGAIWQQEQDKKMYSEEDMKQAFHVGRLYLGREGDTNFEQFIEEFKNK